MAATDSSRFGDPRSGYAQHPHSYPSQQQQHQHHPPLVNGHPPPPAAAVPSGIPQQSPVYAQPPPQQQHHLQQPQPPHHPYAGLQPTAGTLDAAVSPAAAPVPNGRFIPGPAEAPMDSGGSLMHPSYGRMAPQEYPHAHQAHQQQQFYGHHPHHHPQQQQHQVQQHHPQMMNGTGGGGGGDTMQPHHHQPHQHHHPQQQPMTTQHQPQPPPPFMGAAAGVYVPAPPPPAPFPVEQQLDFSQLLRLFNMTISASPLTSLPEHTNDVEASSRGKKLSSLVPPSTWNSMLQSALDGLRSLDPALADKYGAVVRDGMIPEVVDVPPPLPVQSENGAVGGAVGGGEGVGAEEEEGPDGKKRRQDDKGAEPQECLTCHAKSSPEWRRGPFGPRTLCNACGLVYIKIMKRRAKGLPDEEDENGEGGDGDDGSGSDD